MKNKIDACLLKAHSSLISGTNTAKASELLLELFKNEVSGLLDAVDDIAIFDSWDREAVEKFTNEAREKYRLYD